MILVTGATGATGRELVRRLSEKKVEVRALVRNAEKARSKLGGNVELVVGDLERPDSVETAMKGAERVFLLSPPEPRADVLQGNAIEAAKRAKVKHLVKMSAVESAPNSPVRFLKLHGEIEQRLARSGIPYTNLRPHSFMQNTFGYAATLASQGTIYTPPAGAYPPIDVRDIAAVATEVLTTPGHEGKTYTLTGPEVLTHAQMAAKIGSAIGREVKYVEVTPAAAREALLRMGMSEWIVDGLLELYAFYGSGKAATVTREVEAIAKKKPITFDEFARDFAPVFAGHRVPTAT